mmetsp:Transcript_37414/g.58952  ORF Transcript_37414/g.58952 Transcript_37414/m.58952 type:complete len:383 (-) Transcript_37414:70-1218(-)|eukprot:CAMPEP_0201511330 /NCGR_PEP_ID=MMETSP0161_2-20130828/3812_1 /ASSEMBLY_ACC=CAM_ASM_000251 /TAXON_ID=180227 /ORGANISM="Neoparamoeba aestuarina, Strain SoJaBio B1-5/56/2" /LENGTH=382 /DNA_ID=CAMNT_0047906785 /DNA_START=87 /DNA_END=1235 /DNA_ORIENTATION=+
MAKQFDLKAGGPVGMGKDKDYKVGEFPVEFKVDKLVDPTYLYQKGISNIATGSTAETFKPMNLKYKSCLPTRRKEQELLGKKKDRLPFVLEDSGRKKQTFVGSKRGADEGRYVMFLMSGNDSFSVYPIKESYTFTPKITRKVYSFEEAEAEFTRGRGRGRGSDDSDVDEFSNSEDEDQGDEIDFTEKMSDDEDVLGVGGSDDNEDVANMIQKMEDEDDEEDDEEERSEDPENPAKRDPDAEAQEPKEDDSSEQPGGDPLHPSTEEGKKEGEEGSKKRPAESPAGGVEEPAKKRARMEGGSEDDDPDGKKWERMIEEQVKKLLLKKGSMTAQKILKYFKKRHGLDDKKKKARFFKIVSKLATIEESPDGGKVVSLKQIYVPSL